MLKVAEYCERQGLGHGKPSRLSVGVRMNVRIKVCYPDIHIKA